MSEPRKDVAILALRHQLAMLERQPGTMKVRFDASDRTYLVCRARCLIRDRDGKFRSYSMP